MKVNEKTSLLRLAKLIGEGTTTSEAKIVLDELIETGISDTRDIEEGEWLVIIESCLLNDD